MSFESGIDTTSVTFQYPQYVQQCTCQYKRSTMALTTQHFPKYIEQRMSPLLALQRATSFNVAWRWRCWRSCV